MDAPWRLQGLMLRIQAYINVRYNKGSEMYLADTLSRAYLNSPSLQEDLEYINVVGVLPIRQERLAKLKEATDEDDTVQHHKSVIKNGWPDEKQDLPDHILQLL